MHLGVLRVEDKESVKKIINWLVDNGYYFDFEKIDSAYEVKVERRVMPLLDQQVKIFLIGGAGAIRYNRII